MMTSSALKDADRHVAVRVDYSKARQKYAKGGLAKKAEDVRQSGRMGDDMVVHVNKREFDEMRQRWGEPTVNPHTGMPEFFLGDIFSGIGDLVTSGSSYIPVVGESVSGYLKDSPALAQAIGSGLLGAGAGQLLGGNTRSTLLGGALGALAPTVLGGASIFGGGSGASSSGGLSDSDNVFKAGDVNEAGRAEGFNMKTGLAGLSSDKKMMAGLIGALTLAQLYGGSRNASKGGNAAQQAAQQQAAQAQAQFNKPLPMMSFDRAYTPFGGDPRLYGFGGQGQGGWFSNNRVPTRQTPMPGQLADGGRVREKETWSFEEPRRGMTPDAEAMMEGSGLPYARGRIGMPFMDGRLSLQGGYMPDRYMPTTSIGLEYRRAFARGGRTQGPVGALSAMHVSGQSDPYVRGPGGAREDKIPAMLSNNEYVFDAETTALLGDGDPDVGARKLDAMRERIRSHKGKALAQGKISPDAKPAERYLGGKV